MDIMKAYAALCMSGVQNKSSDQQGMNILFISSYIKMYFKKSHTKLNDVLRPGWLVYCLTRKNQTVKSV